MQIDDRFLEIKGSFRDSPEASDRNVRSTSPQERLQSCKREHQEPGEFTDLITAHDEDIACNTLVSDVKERFEPIEPFDPNIIVSTLSLYN